MTDHTPQAAATPLARLHETRLKRWHQNGEALLSFENLRSWLNTAGLVLFTPRPQIAAPAPSLVEAVLGTANAAPTLAETADARALLARLVGEGVAVPLNLLGSTGGAVGETPDFIASAAVFSYLFTLRGDKTWKQPPSTSGASKVSQLAVHAYEILAKSGSRSASDLTAELGNAVTETAVLRALGELWSHLRVLPLPQTGGKPTLWELPTARYTKQIKAGTNAGQPSALSALISLYLGQVAVASEEDIETFLSPLASRSRIRDVIHALTAARQLDTVAVEGRTVLHVAGDVPDFLTAEAQAEPRATVEVAAVSPEAGEGDESAEAGAAEPGSEPRIKKFVPKPRKIGTGYLAKGAPAKVNAGRAPLGKRPGKPFGRDEKAGPRTPKERFGQSERERRPFGKDRETAGERPRFDRPWSEDRPQRPARRTPEDSAGTERRRPARGDGEAGGWKPGFRRNTRPAEGGAPARPERGPRPDRGEGGSAGRGKREFGDRGTRGERSGGFGERSGGFGERSGGFGGRSGGFGGRGGGFGERSGGFKDRGFAGGGERPDRRGERPARFGQGSGPTPRPFRRADGGESAGERPARPFRRTEGRESAGERPARPFRRFDAPRPGGKRPFERRDAGAPGEERPRKVFRPRPEGGAGARGGEGRGERRFGAKRPSKFPSRFAAKSPGGRREGGPSRPAERKDRPSGPKGTFGKRPAKRTFKRREDESA